MSTEPKVPKRKVSTKKKKFFKVKKAKNPIIAGSIVAAVAVAGILGGIYLYNIEPQTEEDILMIGMDYAISSLDPLYNPEDASFDENNMFWSQVIEGLFEYNQSREETPLIPCLAEDFGM